MLVDGVVRRIRSKPRGARGVFLCVFCLLCVLRSLPVSSQTLQSSAPAEAQSAFTQGLRSLHLFEYEDANEAFRRAGRLAPAFALAYWGEAMTYNQMLWRKEDVAAARSALARLSSSRPGRLAKAGTPIEKALLDAVATLFGDGDAVLRRERYADAMGRIYQQSRDDPDIAALYALALLGTVSRGLIGNDDAHEGHVRGLAGSDVQAQVAEILGRVLKAHPDHPGALHYLVHDYDDPEHASRGLAAARRLAAAAPESSHARHMPSHIFLQLGMWRDAAASDRAAFDASVAWADRRHFGPAVRNYHALSWLEYELLQRGRYRDAWSTLAELEPVVKATGQVTLLSNLSSMRARFVVETRRWDLMANERNFANVDDLFAIGISAARSRNETLARMARDGLAARSQSEREGDLRPAIAVMEREIAALIMLAGRQTEEAVQVLRAAAADERRLPPPLGLPEPLKPAPELLGEVLVEAGRPREAIEPFEQVLQRNRNRSLSVLGLARAHRALGDIGASRRRYRELLANFDDADRDVPELDEARRALELAHPPPHYTFVMIAIAALAAVGGFAIARQRRSPRSTVRSADRKRARGHSRSM
jgi:tetratricopeptide (TPR) repeat protein